MGIEIERKFLVDAARVPLPDEGTEIRQGYLVRGEERSVRVRLSRPIGGAGEAKAEGTLTIKGPGGLSRAEFDYPIPVDDAEALLDTLCLPGEIRKTRYLVPAEPRPFEVDVYAGRYEGLVVAEVELDSADTEVGIPDWVTEEVTGDPAWTNAALSVPERAYRPA
jgi:adenylate cyclase